jgi:pseudaminic acid synthase
MKSIEINGRLIGPDHPPYVIAELSGNHANDFDTAAELVRAAAACGADAVKIQTYTADTLTISSDEPWFRVGAGTAWEGRRLFDLYEEASTPWEWHGPLAEIAAEVGVAFFSTPFDRSATDFLEGFDVPAYKIASFEIVDHALIAHVASKGRPLMLSTGMATVAEIDDAVRVAREAGATELALLRCNSAYPASPGEMDLATIPHMEASWDVPVGLSDHTLGAAASTVAVGLGACIIEKHFALSREEPGPDTAFSMEPADLVELVSAVRTAWGSVGGVRYGPSRSELPSLVFRRSLFVVEDVAAGEVLTTANVRAIRPGYGLAPGILDSVLGRRARGAITRGTPLTLDLLL